MRRILVLLTLVTLAGGLGALSTSAVVGAPSVGGCGGNDKPPLTPDQIEGDLEAGAAVPPGPAK